MPCFESRLARNSLPRDEAERWSPEQVLRWGFERFGRDIAIASGFGAEGIVLIDIAARIKSDFRVFTLDTGFFFPETYALIEKVERRYGIRVERCRPALSPAEQARRYGEALWTRQPDKCCAIRKVDPLKAKLVELSAWVAAIRREQTAARANAAKVEWDAKFDLVKLNPLADWTHNQVWEYIRKHRVPHNPLHDRGYPSIGCTHCTRPVRIGEDLRAGRWSGFGKTECGLHTRSTSVERSHDSV
ncbi:MAG TPA: phosphoadenylyl-sulfate reductase [Terriglobia bacterium]|nr:phosphoadenylyl-sulfate reductase [Terriglobia bacterium]